MRVTVRQVRAGDRTAWDELFAAYARFYRSEQTPRVRERVWGWLMDDENATTGFVAERTSGELVAFMHCHSFPRPLTGSTGIYVDDLFVTPAARRSRSAMLLLQCAQRLAEERGASIVRGITRERNYRARTLYDRFAARTDWIVYDRDPTT